MSKYWFIHKDGGRFVFRTSKYQTDKVNNPDLPVLVMKEILDEVILNTDFSKQVKGKAYIPRMDKLWMDCTEEQRRELAKILPDNALEYCRATMVQLRSQQMMNEIQNQCAKTITEASRIIYMHKNDYQDEESKKGMLLYVSKHPNECSIVYTKEDLEKALNQKKGSENVTLVLMSDNNRKDKRFLGWTLNTAGKGIGDVVRRHNCIGHVRLISCHAGTPDVGYIQTHKPADEKIDVNNPLSARMLFIHDSDDHKLPYAEDALASQIWRTVMDKNPTRELSISASPNYLHLDNQTAPTQFIGSSKAAPFGVTHNFKNASQFTNLKSITLSTAGGVKAVKLKNKTATEESPNVTPANSTSSILKALQVNAHVASELIKQKKEKNIPENSEYENRPAEKVRVSPPVNEDTSNTDEADDTVTNRPK